MILCIAFLQCDVFNLDKKADGNGNRNLEDLNVSLAMIIMLGGYSPGLLMRNKMYYVLLSSFAVYI